MTWGVFGSFGIAVAFYLVQALGMQSWTEPLFFASDQWYFVFPLIVGFGVQTTLLRRIHVRRHRSGGVTVAATGGVSTGAMVACCLHNIALLFPALGLGGAAVFFAEYQAHVFSVSILLMLFGIAYLIIKDRQAAAILSCHRIG